MTNKRTERGRHYDMEDAPELETLEPEDLEAQLAKVRRGIAHLSVPACTKPAGGLLPGNLGLVYPHPNTPVPREQFWARRLI